MKETWESLSDIERKIDYLTTITNKSNFSGGLEGPKINDVMLEKAMVEAVKAGLFPQHVDFETYNKNWFGMKRVLEAALAT